jgi:hypothetical protein
VSTDDQADSGLGLAGESEKLRAMAVVKGWNSIELADDGVSGKSLNRLTMAQAPESWVVRLFLMARAPPLPPKASTLAPSAFPGRRKVSGIVENSTQKRVELRGIEPLTSSMPWKRSTN